MNRRRKYNIKNAKKNFPRKRKKKGNFKNYMIKFIFIIYLLFMLVYLKKIRLLIGIIVNQNISTIKNMTIKDSKKEPFEIYIR